MKCLQRCASHGFRRKQDGQHEHRGTHQLAKHDGDCVTDRSAGTCPGTDGHDERCTDSGKGRVVSRAFDEDYRELARQRQTTEAYQKALRKRQVWVEPLFGEAKDWHQLRQFRLRGLANVNMYGLLVAAGQNLKRYLAVVRRGHRPAEGQRAVAVLPCLCPLR